MRLATLALAMFVLLTGCDWFKSKKSSEPALPALPQATPDPPPEVDEQPPPAGEMPDDEALPAGQDVDTGQG